MQAPAIQFFNGPSCHPTNNKIKFRNATTNIYYNFIAPFILLQVVYTCKMNVARSIY